MSDQQFNRDNLIEHLPDAFACHRLVLDDQGNPADYIFLQVNSAFEQMTGLKRENIIDRKVTEVIPSIEKDQFDWIGIFGKIARHGGSLNFEQYSEPLKRWYAVKAYSVQPGYFCTVFNEITARKEELASMRYLLEQSTRLIDSEPTTFNYRESVQTLQNLSGAKFTAFNTYEEGSTKTVTRAITGLSSAISHAAEILGFEISGRAWDIKPERLRKIEGGKLVRFRTLFETSMGVLSKATSSMLHQYFGLGDVYVIELAYGGRETMGDIIFLMPKGEDIQNREAIELYAGHLGAVLGRLKAEEMLVRNEQRLSAAQINARAGFWEYDIKKETLFWSRECEALFGLDEGEFEGNFDAFLKRVHPEDKEYVLSMNQQITESGEGIPLDYEYRIIKKDKNVIWVKETAGVVNGKNGKAAFVTGFIMDITERTQAEEAMRHSEQRFQNMLALIPDLVSIQDPDMNIVYSNWSGFGAVAEEKRVLNTKCYKTYRGFEDICSDCRALKVIQTEEAIQEEVMLPGGNWIDLRIIPILSQDGSVELFVEWVRDITERKQAEHEVFAQKKLLEGVMDNISDVLAIQKPDHTIESYNQAGYDLLGKSAQEVKDKKCYELIGRDRECEECTTRQALQTKKMEQMEKYVPEMGIYLDCRSNPILDEAGNVERVVEHLRDITERKQREEQINQLVKEQDILLNNIEDQIWYLTDVETYGAVNEARAAFLGLEVKDLAHQKMWDLLPSAEEAQVCIEGNRQVFRDKKPLNTEEYAFNGSGELRLLNITKTPRLDENGNVLSVVCSAADITERRAAEDALAERLAFEKMTSELSSYFVSLPPERIDEGINYALQTVGAFYAVDRSYIVQLTEDGKYMTKTHEWCAEGVEEQITGLKNQPVESLSWWAERIKKDSYVFIPDAAALPSEAAAEREAFQDQGIRSLLSVPVTRGNRIFGFLGFDAVREKREWSDDQAALLKVIAELIVNILIRNENDQTIRHLSFHDQLTGLYNRHYFVNELNRLEDSRAYPIAIISADLDGLKLINDTLGHREGDQYLKESALLLKENLRTSDLLARIGGDEFALVLPGTDQETAAKLVQRIRRSAEQYNQQKAGLPVSISIGFAVSESSNLPLEETYNLADGLMYKDKIQRSKEAKTEIVRAMLATLYEREDCYSGNNELEQKLCIRLGQKAGLSEKQLADLLLLAQVHDIGMITVPRGLLQRQESLTGSELENYRQHTERGYRIALASPELEGIADLLLYHHENFDGSGYPRGLQGQDIPIECRILAIVDTYNAIIKGRPNRKAISTREALAELKKLAGSRFDPELVGLFASGCL